MQKNQLLQFAFMLLTISCFMSCQQKETTAIQKPSHDQVHQHLVNKIRLGDGVPLNLNLAIRWKVNDEELFHNQFSTEDTFNLMILQPRAYELISTVANTFGSIDSVFYSQRQVFISEIKNELLEKLGEPGVHIKEVIFKDIYFPQSYTLAMEKAGLHRQEIERIHQEKLIQMEEAEAQRQKAEADGKVSIARAQAESKTQKIKAETEKYHRQNELAKAETLAQVDKTRAKAEAERRRVLAQAELDNQRNLKDLELQRTRELNKIAIDKKRQLNEAELDNQRAMAGICSQNPVYATYLVNRELAAHVEFAVLPTGTDSNIFSNILNNKMPGLKTPLAE